MTAEIIDGKKIAADIKKELIPRIIRLQEKRVNPKLVAILVGDDPTSLSYLRSITRNCNDVGVLMDTTKLPGNITQKELLQNIGELNHDSRVHGILLLLPLPGHLDALEAESTISPAKDVDGTNPISTGKLLRGEETFFPSTPQGVQELLVRSGHSPEGKHVVIIGRSNIVGKPLMGILVQKQNGANATVTLCHTGTKNLAKITQQADILVAALGKARAITANMIKNGTVVIDVGVNEIKDIATGKSILVGDVDFEVVKEKASAITPVPGGTGPVTSVMLIANIIKAAEKLSGN